jgi:hypothetical protein
MAVTFSNTTMQGLCRATYAITWRNVHPVLLLPSAMQAGALGAARFMWLTS